jgi:hypothetical protein
LLAAWALCREGLARRFAIALPLALLLTLANPYTARLVSTEVTGAAYWRSFWPLPLPILMAFVLASPLQLAYGASRARKQLAWAGSVLVTIAFAAWIPRYSGLAPENHVRLGWPRLKVPQPAYRWAATIDEVLPARAYVIAPPEVSDWLVTFSRHPYPLRVRRYHQGMLDQESSRLREQLTSLVAAPGLGQLSVETFREGLVRFEISGVCLAGPTRGTAVAEALSDEGFSRVRGDSGWELWVRSGPQATSE